MTPGTADTAVANTPTAGTDVAAVESAEVFSGRRLRDVFGRFATGVTVVTTRSADEPYGMTANAFSAVSLDPPLVLICVISGTRGEEAIGAAGIFAVNVLTVEQEPLSRYFASKHRPTGSNAFDEVRHHHEVTGAPVLDGAAAFLDCRLHAEHSAGDHTIFIGEVLGLGAADSTRPLLFFGGTYRVLSET